MTAASPRFSIIVPSYNGGDYLRTCVRSVLSQTHADFELIVLEDASTDGSREWLQSLNDPRLKLYAAPQNLGIVGNWARILEVPKGEFFTIVGQDDGLDPDYLATMDDLIRRHPEASLYHAPFRFIDGAGETIRHARPIPERESAADYIAALYAGARDTHGCGYLMRSCDYAAVGGIRGWEKLLFADDALWISLARLSYKATAARECFFCRHHGANTSITCSWQSWLSGLVPYAEFLNEVARQDPDFERALRAHGPDYFSNYGYMLAMRAYTEANARNESVDAERIAALRNALESITPNTLQRLDAIEELRLRQKINRNTATRQGYKLYSALRAHRLPGRGLLGRLRRRLKGATPAASL